MNGSSIGVERVVEALLEVGGCSLHSIELSDRLADVGVVGVDLLACIALLEDRFAIEFPADLLSAIETVDDLVYYTAVKASQR